MTQEYRIELFYAGDPDTVRDKCVMPIDASWLAETTAQQRLSILGPVVGADRARVKTLDGTIVWESPP